MLGAEKWDGLVVNTDVTVPVVMCLEHRRNIYVNWEVYKKEQLQLNMSDSWKVKDFSLLSSLKWRLRDYLPQLQNFCSEDGNVMVAI